MEPREQIIIELQNAREKMFTCKVLDILAQGKLPKEDWIIFAVQRYLAASHFEKLLEAGLSKAESGSPLALALQNNLNDEHGDNEEHSHATWRKDFYNTIGATEQVIQKSVLLEGTQFYFDELTKIAQENVLKIAGALLVLEFTIPYEFKKIQLGRDKTFENEFIDKLNDSEKLKLKKAKARMYIDDHILHDARSHYPELLSALEPYLTNHDDYVQIKEGIVWVTNAKQKFYESLDKKLMT